VSDARLLPREDRATVEVAGADRADYLHRMLTQDVKGLAAGRAAYACVLTPRGRILSDLWLWDLGERWVLDLPAAGAAKAIPHLERYVIADDVVFTDVSATTARFALLGDAAAAALARVGATAPAPGRVVRARVAGADVDLLRSDLGAVPSFEAMLAAADGRAVTDALRAVPGVAVISPEEHDVLRVEEGVPAFGRELDEQVLPNEALLESAISWTKGCFPGQEPVVMARHRGHPATLLVALAVEAAAPPPSGAALLAEGRPIGRVTSAVRGARRPGIRALGYVRHAAARPGATFDVAGGGRATVVDR
jgi:folate-binding protein YgfZ